MDNDTVPETMPSVISREEAKARGLMYYFTGEKCKNNHLCERWVSSYRCTLCVNPNFGANRNRLKVCHVPGCESKWYAGTFCLSHYERNRRHGHPLGGTFRHPKGTLLKWIEDHLSFSGEECLMWPYATDGRGYGQISYKGKHEKAHIVMCILKHGERPSPKHQAAHSCGQGKRGCAHPEHLRWATQSENELDKALHGTDMRGEKHHNAKLTKSDVLRIRAFPKSVTSKDIAKQFGVTRNAVCDIRHFKTWAWLD